MASIAQIRRDYPQYHDLTDKQIADALHARYYSDVPLDTFYTKVGLAAPGKDDDSLLSTAWSGLKSGAATLAQDIGGIGSRYLGTDLGLTDLGRSIEPQRSAADRAMLAAQAERERDAKPGVLSRAVAALGSAAHDIPDAMVQGAGPIGTLGSLAAKLLPDTPEEAAVQGAKITAPLQSPRAAVDFAARQVPATLATLPLGAVAGRAVLAAGVGSEAAGTLAARTALGSGVVVNAANNARQASEDVIASGGTPEQARAAYDKAFAIAAAASVAAARMPSLEKQLFTGAPAAGSLAKRVAKGAAKAAIAEAPQEFVEEAGGQLGQNVATGAPLSKDVLSSGVLGAIGGVGVGAPLGGAHGTVHAETPTGDGTAKAPIVATAPEHVEQAAANVAEPTEAQKEAGNYRKGHVNVQGLDIAIENPKGSERSGVDEDGKPWAVTLPDHYGYVKRTEGADGDAVDVYIGPNPQSSNVYVVDQQHPDKGTFDEHKAMIGYDTPEQAMDAYHAAFSDGRGPERAAAVTPMTVDEFKGWLKDGDTKQPAAQAAPVAPDVPVKPTVGADAVNEDMLSPVFVAPKGEPGFSVEDTHGDGHVLYSVFRDENGDPKGVVRFPATPDGREPVEGYRVGISSYVDPRHRRQGVATKLYNQLRDAGHDIDALSGTEDLTPDGAAFVNSRRAAMRDETPVPSISEDVSAPVMVGAPPAAGIAPANIGTDGRVYIGDRGTSHFAVTEKYPDIEFDGETGFVNPAGEYLTREQALEWVNANGEDIKPSDNMGSSLDALDYRDQSRLPPDWALPRDDTPQVEAPVMVGAGAVVEPSVDEAAPPSEPPPPPDEPPAGGEPPSEPPSSRAPRQALAARVKPMLDKMGETFRFRYSGAMPGSDVPIANALGISPDELSDRQSLSKSLELLDSSTAGRLKELERKHFDPILKKMSELRIDPQDAGMYLLARAAPDRNAKVAARNPNLPDGGSGLTNAEAQEVIADLGAQGKLPALKEVAALHDKLIAHSQQEAVRGGLYSPDAMAELRKAEPNYTPLKGFAADGDMQVAPEDAPHAGYENARKGVPVKTYLAARGRESLAFNPLFNAIADAQKITERAQRNLAAQPLLTNISENPEAYEGVARLYTDAAPDMYWTGEFNEETGEKIMRPVNMAGDPRYINIKRDGVNHYIKPENSEAGRALREAFEDMSPPQLHWAMKALTTFTGLMKSLRTRFSPGYLLGTAPFRDIQDALVTAAAEEKLPGSAAFGRKLAPGVARYMLPGSGNYQAIHAYLRGGEPTDPASAEALAYLEQMVEDGGSIGHAMIRDAERTAADAVKSLERMRKVQEGSPLAMTAEGAKALGKALDDFSQALDMQPRLATYRAALDAGIARPDAARLALNSSLNLTKRMRGGRGLEVIWPFINAGVASVAKNVHLLRSPRYRNIMYSLAGLGSAVTMMNMALGGGNDDDHDGQSNYADIPDAEKVRNLIVYYGMGADDYVNIPLGFMVGFPLFVGQKLTETAAGLNGAESAATTLMSGVVDLAKGFVNSYSPVNGSADTASDIPMGVVPYPMKMPVELWRNKDGWGKPIYNEPFDKDTAPSSVSREETAAAYKWWAEAVNRLSGGRNGVAGKMSAAPEAWRYIVDNLAGGPGTTAKQVVGFADKATRGDLSAQDTPVFGRFLGHNADYAAMNKFYEAAQRLAPLAKAENDADEAEWASDRARFPHDTDPDVLAAFRDARAQLQQLGKERKAVLDGVEGDERQKLVDEYRQRRNEIYVDFNRVYNERR